MRTIVDETGAEWTVWEVRPGSERFSSLGERRRALDRREEPAPDPIIERRRDAERRTRPIERPRAVSSAFADGWLAVQVNGVRRRVAPVPHRWAALSDAELLAVCRTVMAAVVGTADGERPAGPASGAAS